VTKEVQEKKIANIDKNDRYNRKLIYKRIFKGEVPLYEDMFKTRGYRGLNFLPFPNFIKEQLSSGIITINPVKTEATNGNYRYDFTNKNK
jgi:hypothetical protein